MSDAETSGRGRKAGAAGGEDAGLGVRSSVPPTLHPTAQKILAAARKILTERGYQSMTLQAISAEAQVNKAGVWYYFGGKQQLVLALLEDVTIRESLHFGTMPPEGATLAERVDLIVGTASRSGSGSAGSRRSTSAPAGGLATPSCTTTSGPTTRAGTTGPRKSSRRRWAPLPSAPVHRRRSASSPRSCSTGSSWRWSSRPRSSTWMPRWTTARRSLLCGRRRAH